jgi:hypothetical protein
MKSGSKERLFSPYLAKELCVLSDEPSVHMKAAQINITEPQAIQGDRSGSGVVKTHQEVDQRRLSATALACSERP